MQLSPVLKVLCEIRLCGFLIAKMGFILHNFPDLSTLIQPNGRTMKHIIYVCTGIWTAEHIIHMVAIINKKAHADENHSRLLHHPLWILLTLDFRYPTGFWLKEFLIHNSTFYTKFGQIFRAIIRILNKYKRVLACGKERLWATLDLNIWFLHEFLNIYEQLSKSNKLSGHPQFRWKQFVLGAQTFSGCGILINFCGEFEDILAHFNF